MNNSLTWPRSRAREAMLALARSAKLPVEQLEAPAAFAVERIAAQLGLEAEPVSVAYGDLDALLRNAGPALLVLAGDRLVALLEARGRRLALVAPDQRVHVIEASAVRDALCAAIEARAALPLERILDQALVPAPRRTRARKALLREQLAAQRIEAGFILRPLQSASIAAQLRWSRLLGRVGVLATAHAAQHVLGLLGFWLIGKGALEGRIDHGWLLAFGLVLFSQPPLRVLAAWSHGFAAVEAGALLKQRLVAGAVELSPDAVRTEGAGQLLGRIFESEAIESLALNGGFTGLSATLELLTASVVLGLGAGGALHLVLLAATVGVCTVTALRYARARTAWTEARLALTHDLVERMVGHRTRLAQQAPERWHDGEDGALDRYLELASQMDRHGVRLVALAPRAWIVLGLAGLVPSFVWNAATPSAIAVSLAGVVLAQRALHRLVVGFASLAAAAIAWRTVAPIFHAAEKAERPIGPEFAQERAKTAAPASESPRENRPLLDASELVFRYRDRAEPVLRGCSVRVHAGDRLLIEGSSGGGKSTLGALLAGLREPESGLLLLDGYDKNTLGRDGWRRRVVAAPQFHENHVFASSFAWNLLMGRAWPPSEADLALAETICRELDLGPLLERMPAGLQQMVGETGWQLSHGERSRLFVARALLQEGDVMILDESFAALDPHTLQRALHCVLARANALVMIAHP